MEPNAITISVPWLPMLIAFGVVSVGFGIWGMGARLSRARGLKLEKLESLFPYPWNEAYDRCSDISSNPESRNFLRQWIKSQRASTGGHDELPFLSSKAVRTFARVLTYPSNEHSDQWVGAQFWQTCLDILALYDSERIETAHRQDALKGEKEASEKAKVAEEEAEELKKKQDLFRYPWTKAYEECQTKSPAGAQAWLRKWIPEQDSLCPISVEAADALIEVTGNYDERKEFFELLSPYLDTGCYDTYRNVADYNLREELPTEWYVFWTELKNYPSRYSLFMKRIGKFSQDGTMVHPALEIPLTSDQAALLSRALGNGNEKTAKKYAEGLAECVSTGDEVPLAHHRNRVKGSDLSDVGRAAVSVVSVRVDDDDIPF